MTAGRKPKPTHLKALAGTYRPDRANPAEPQPPVGLPEPPAELDAVGRQMWEFVGRELHACGMMTTVDGPQLHLLCMAWSRYCMASKKITPETMLLKSPKGYPIQNPYLSIMNKAFEQVQKTLTELGMSPSSRSRVMRSGGGDEGGEMETWLNG